MMVNSSSNGSRRQCLRLIAGAALLPFALDIQAGAARAATAGFNPPGGKMVLLRNVQRELADGAMIAVQRRWSIEFIPDSVGFLVTGQQLSADVSAPPALEFLAQLERERVESGLFPMHLSPQGVITGAGSTPDSTQFNRAAALAKDHIARAKLTEGDEQAAQRMLASLQQSTAHLASKLPHDLFFPKNAEWHGERDIALPNGEAGKIAIFFNARLCADGGVLAHAERQIVTTVGITSRTAQETWSLSLA